MTATYPELDELHAAFVAVLAADPAPAAPLAMLASNMATLSEGESIQLHYSR